MRRRAILAAALVFLACPARAADLQEIWKPSGEGWYDLTLSVDSVEQTADGYTAVTARGLHRRTVVGLKVSFKNGLKPGFAGGALDRAAFAEDGIVYSSIGPESDALLAAMAGLYRVSAPAAKFAPRVGVVAIALQGNPSSLVSEPVKFKVFFNPKADESRYAELYTNIDLRRKKLELFEKDEEYRANIVKALSGNP
jgi:hypothetical protein